MANVTVLGASDAVVSIPFTSAHQAAIAQAAADAVSQMVLAGTLVQQNYQGGTDLPTSGSDVGVIVSAPGGTGGAIVSLGPDFAFVGDSSGDPAVFASDPETVDATVIGGNASNLTYFNAGTGASFYSGGGANNFLENSPAASGVAYLDGGIAFVGATMGATTVEAADDAVLAIAGGGAATVDATDGTETIFVVGGSDVPVQINGAGATGIVVNVQSGAALINPGAANLTVFGASGGTASVFGADSLSGGTGALSVFGADGYFVAGSGGGNLMMTSTDPNATTLVGSSGTDTMFGFASGDAFRSTSGQDMMVTYATGDTLIAGTGQTTMFGAASGGNTFVFDGAGSAFAFGAYGSQSAAPNNYIDSVGGATVTINDFRSGKDLFEIVGSASVGSISITPAQGGAPASSNVVLTDGTQITFNYAAVKSSDFTNI